MNREAWQVAVHGVTRVRYDLVTKLPPPPHPLRKEGYQTHGSKQKSRFHMYTIVLNAIEYLYSIGQNRW